MDKFALPQRRDGVVALSEAIKYSIQGHHVAFPVKPYGVQVTFMAKLIKSIDSREHALLEAPTGCGKTLALLCGSLAWQTKFKEAQSIDEHADEATFVQLGMAAAGANASGALDPPSLSPESNLLG